MGPWDGTNSIIQAALRPAGAPAFGPPIDVTTDPPGTTTQHDAFSPDVAVDPAGDAVAAWTKRNGSTNAQIIQAAEMPHGSASFNAPQDVPPTDPTAEEAKVVVDDAGDAIAAWSRPTLAGTTLIDTASLPAGSSSWSGADLRGTSIGGSPDVSIDPIGQAAVYWAGDDGVNSSIFGVGRPAGGAFGNVIPVSQKGQHATDPHIAVDQKDDGYLVWTRSDGKNTIATAWIPMAPPSPPPPGTGGVGPIGGIPGPPGGGAVPPRPPLLRLLRLTPGTFSTAGRIVRGHCVASTPANRALRSCTRPVSLRVSFAATSGGTVTFSLQQAARGRLARVRCVAATRRNTRHRRCTRLIALRGRLTRQVHAGTNSFVYTRRGLKPGSYRLLATPSVKGTTGRALSTSFRVVR